jgi:hypothetical protein
LKDYLKRSVYHNNLNWGLEYPNTSGTITDTYTINLYVKNTNWGNKIWGRIIDFSKGLSDVGFYYRMTGGTSNRCLDFYPAEIVGACPYFNDSTYYLLTFTRNGLTDIIDVYINNTFFASSNDTAGRYVGTPGTPIYIFRDDQAETCESVEANIAYLSLTNQYSTQKIVDSVYNNICDSVNAPISSNFSFTPNVSCGLSSNVIVNYTGDIISPGTGYTFNWDWDGGNVISGTGIGPYIVNWATPGTKNVTLIISNACGNQSIKTNEILIKPGSFSTIILSICQGQTYLGYNTSGTYIDIGTIILSTPY